MFIIFLWFLDFTLVPALAQDLNAECCIGVQERSVIRRPLMLSMFVHVNGEGVSPRAFENIVPA